MALQNDSRIRGVLTGPHTIKTTMFADDTTIILRTQAEADAAVEVLHIYGKASGARLNWDKSYLLLLAGLQLVIEGVQEIIETVHYKHLGVPVGDPPNKHLKVFWEKMVQKF